MSNDIRVLVVDDAATFRTGLRVALNREPDICVVGSAPNGVVALRRIKTLKPDLVTLDFEMPEMDGLETLREIRKQFPDVKVVMVSAHTKRGAALTLDALTAGATDFVEKPTAESAQEGLLAMSAALVPMIRGIAGGGGKREGRGLAALRRTQSLLRLRSPKSLLVVGISTGGPNALQTVIPSLPADIAVPIVIVQHMPEIFTAQLADRLNSKSAIQVSEAVEGEEIVPGHVYIAPGGRHTRLRLVRGVMRIALDDGPKLNSCRPSADALFESAASESGAGVLACVMTGMGSDGQKGATIIREKKGAVLVQERASCVVWGMPRAIEEANLADEAVALDEMANAWVRFTRAEVSTGRE